ncbi:MAG TPA: signal recognition particle-docking protein FtsY [Clostridia bacterium]|nr:signal recognition particle-docking protein FtsY [Clostridia bacterium]
MSFWSVFLKKVGAVVTGRTIVDEELFEELEETLILADVGVETACQLIERVRQKMWEEKLKTPEDLQNVLQAEIITILKAGNHHLTISQGTLTPILIVGVNGVGKTTSLAKLAYWLKKQGYEVMTAAADTFRAGAIEQLEIWCQRVGIELVRHQEGADPAAVVYDALQAAKARGKEVLLIDTAGRLQTKKNLMEELKKIKRIITRENPDNEGEVLLVLDATTGQNAFSQTELFAEAVEVSGVILTKMDGTAKGGVILGVQNEYHLPVKFLGVGEQITDFREFNPEEFVQELI